MELYLWTPAETSIAGDSGTWKFNRESWYNLSSFCVLSIFLLLNSTFWKSKIFCFFKQIMHLNTFWFPKLFPWVHPLEYLAYWWVLVVPPVGCALVHWSRSKGHLKVAVQFVEEWLPSGGFHWEASHLHWMMGWCGKIYKIQFTLCNDWLNCRFGCQSTLQHLTQNG